jgi:hypothetical protein
MSQKRSLAFWGGIGCLSLLLLCGGGGAAVFVGVFGAIKRSTPYQQAVARVRADPQAVGALGQPVQTGWMVSGSVQADQKGGHAALAIPVHGPKASGVLQVEASRAAQGWTYTTLNLVLDGSKQEFDLLSSDDAAPPQKLER